MIRARPGYRPIVRVERSNLERPCENNRQCSSLDRQNLILDGIDLIVDVRDLSPEQTVAVFVLGIESHPEELLDHDPQRQRTRRSRVVRVEANATRPTRIRLERTLVRGQFARQVLTWPGALRRIVLDRSVIAGRARAPRFALRMSEAAADTAILLQSTASWPGPVPSSSFPGKSRSARPSRWSVRAFGSVFGRLHGVGVASVISSSSSAEAAAKQIDWEGDHNLFAGWKGFFACGSDPTVTMPGLAEVRSTWNKADQESQEILSPWPLSVRSWPR